MTAEQTYETALIEYGTFMVAGVTEPATEASDFSLWWKKLYDRLGEAETEAEAQLATQRLAAVEKLQRVGVVMPDADDSGVTYTAGFIVPGGIKDVAALGLTGVVVPGAMYATALVEGPLVPGLPPAHVKAGFEYLAQTFIPSKNLTPTGVCLEVYGPGDTGEQNYRMYLWQAVTGLPA